jgi:hypothetical protein
VTLIVIDIGETAADVPAVLATMDGDGLELVGVDGSHVGCRIAGIVEEGHPGFLDPGKVEQLYVSPLEGSRRTRP